MGMTGRRNRADALFRHAVCEIAKLVPNADLSDHPVGYPMQLCLGTEPMATKTGTDRAKKAALDKALGSMFGKLQARAVPEHLVALADDLEASLGEQPALKKARRA